VEKLLEIRDNVRECHKKRWWQRGKLDEGRRKDLEQLIAERIHDIREALTTALLTEIRSIGKQEDLARKEKLQRYSSFEELIWQHLEDGQLTESQHAFLMGVIQNQRNSITR
jgi:hypothetical protein